MVTAAVKHSRNSRRSSFISRRILRTGQGDYALSSIAQSPSASQLCYAQVEVTAMHVRMACTLFVAFALAWASLPAAAQVNPSTAQTQKSSVQQTPPAAKVLQTSEPAEKPVVRFFSDQRDAQGRLLRIPETPNPRQTDVATDLPRTCAHILIYVAPPSADDQMMIKAPRDESNPTPTFQGLPPCRRDFRPMFFAALGPEFRFMKPGRPDSPRPGLEKPSSLTQPK